MYIYSHAHLHTHIHTHRHTHAYIYAHTHIYTYPRRRTQILMYIHTPALIHTHTHTPTHIYTHTLRHTQAYLTHTHSSLVGLGLGWEGDGPSGRMVWLVAPKGWVGRSLGLGGEPKGGGWCCRPPCSAWARTVNGVGTGPAPSSSQASLHSPHCLRRLGQGSQAWLNWGPGQTALSALPFPSPLGREGCVGNWGRRKLPEPVACHPPAHTGRRQRSTGTGYGPKSPDSITPHPSQGRQPWKSSPPPPVPSTMTFISTPIPGVHLPSSHAGLSPG